MKSRPPTRAVLLDALGTLVELEPPWVHLAKELGTEPDERLVRAVRAEMGYYREHSHEGRDAESLAALRARCAAILSDELGREIPVETMMGAIRFRAFDDAAPALAELRDLGLILVCVSNWDVSLPDVLVRCGLDGALDGVVTSAQAGARKPDPAIFQPALRARRLLPRRGPLRRRHPRRGRPGRPSRRDPDAVDRPRRGRGHRLPRCHPAPSHRVTSPGLPPKKPAIEPASQSTAGSAPPPAAAALPTTATSPPEPAGSWTGSGPGKPGRSWGPGRVAVGVLALLLTTVFEVGVVSAFDPGLNSLAARLVTQALLAVTLVGVAFAVTAEPNAGIAPPSALGLRRPLRSPFKIAAAAYLGYIVFAIVYSGAGPPAPEGHHRATSGSAMAAFGTVAAGVLIVRRRARSPRRSSSAASSSVGSASRLSFPIAALISAAIFGLFHYTGAGSIAVVPQLAFLGFALCWVYEETGSIYPTMAIHALNNAIAFIFLTS